MKLIMAAFALAVLLLGGPPARASSEVSLQVVVFTAPWCSDCRTALPGLQTALDTLTDRQDQFDVLGYLCSGDSPSAKPTQEQADKYRADLKVKFPIIPDVWKWQTYKKLFGADYQLPAVAVLDEDGEVLERFRGATFQPEAIAKFVKEHTDAGTGTGGTPVKD